MNPFESTTKLLRWLMAVLVVIFVADVTGCGGGGGSATPTPTPSPATLVSIAVTPASAVISVGGTQQFVATGTYSDASSSVVTTTASWASASSVVATVGLHTGFASGVSASASSVAITATLSGKTGTAHLTVNAAGPAAINLLSIATNNFVILSNSATTGITDTGSHSSVITGNIGLSPGTAAAIGVYCSEITGLIYGADAAYVGSGATACFHGLPADNTLVGTAVGDMTTAYNDAAGRAQGADAAHLNVGAGTLNGQTFPPGTYTWTTAVNITGDITLSGTATDTWLFQTSGDVTLAPAGSLVAGTHIILSGGALAKNVFWQVGGGVGATLGTYSTFNGIILSATTVTMQTGAVLHGRALAKTAVILDANPVGP